MKPLLCFAVLVLTSAKFGVAEEKKTAKAKDKKSHDAQGSESAHVLDLHPAFQQLGVQNVDAQKGYGSVFNKASGQHVIDLVNINDFSDTGGKSLNDYSLKGERESEIVPLGLENVQQGKFTGGVSFEQVPSFDGEYYKGIKNLGLDENKDLNSGYGSFGSHNLGLNGQSINLGGYNLGDLGQHLGGDGSFDAFGGHNLGEHNLGFEQSGLSLSEHAGIEEYKGLDFGLGDQKALYFGNSGFGTDLLKHPHNQQPLEPFGKGTELAKGTTVGHTNTKHTSINLEHIGKPEMDKHVYGGTLDHIKVSKLNIAGKPIELGARPLADSAKGERRPQWEHLKGDSGKGSDYPKWDKPKIVPLTGEEWSKPELDKFKGQQKPKWEAHIGNVKITKPSGASVSVFKFDESTKTYIDPNTKLNYGEIDAPQKNAYPSHPVVPQGLPKLKYEILHKKPSTEDELLKEAVDSGAAIINQVPIAYAEYIDKPHPLRIYVEKPVLRQKIVKVPYKVPIPKPVIVEKKVPFPVKVFEQVAKPYPVYKDVPVPKVVYVDKPVPKYVEKPYPVKVIKPTDGKRMEGAKNLNDEKPLTWEEFKAIKATAEEKYSEYYKSKGKEDAEEKHDWNHAEELKGEGDLKADDWKSRETAWKAHEKSDDDWKTHEKPKSVIPEEWKSYNKDWEVTALKPVEEEDKWKVYSQDKVVEEQQSSKAKDAWKNYSSDQVKSSEDWKSYGNDQSAKASENWKSYSNEQSAKASEGWKSYSSDQSAKASEDSKTYSSDQSGKTPEEWKSYSGDQSAKASENWKSYSSDQSAKASNDWKNYSNDQTAKAPEDWTINSSDQSTKAPEQWKTYSSGTSANASEDWKSYSSDQSAKAPENWISYINDQSSKDSKEWKSYSNDQSAKRFSNDQSAKASEDWKTYSNDQSPKATEEWKSNSSDQSDKASENWKSYSSDQSAKATEDLKSYSSDQSAKAAENWKTYTSHQSAEAAENVKTNNNDQTAKSTEGWKAYVDDQTTKVPKKQLSTGWKYHNNEDPWKGNTKNRSFKSLDVTKTRPSGQLKEVVERPIAEALTGNGDWRKVTERPIVEALKRVIDTSEVAREDQWSSGNWKTVETATEGVSKEQHWSSGNWKNSETATQGVSNEQHWSSRNWKSLETTTEGVLDEQHWGSGNWKSSETTTQGTPNEQHWSSRNWKSLETTTEGVLDEQHWGSGNWKSSETTTQDVPNEQHWNNWKSSEVLNDKPVAQALKGNQERWSSNGWKSVEETQSETQQAFNFDYPDIITHDSLKKGKWSKQIQEVSESQQNPSLVNAHQAQSYRTSYTGQVLNGDSPYPGSSLTVQASYSGKASDASSIVNTPSFNPIEDSVTKPFKPSKLVESQSRKGKSLRSEDHQKFAGKVFDEPNPQLNKAFAAFVSKPERNAAFKASKHLGSFYENAQQENQNQFEQPKYDNFQQSAMLSFTPNEGKSIAGNLPLNSRTNVIDMLKSIDTETSASEHVTTKKQLYPIDGEDVNSSGGLLINVNARNPRGFGTSDSNSEATYKPSVITMQSGFAPMS